METSKTKISHVLERAHPTLEQLEDDYFIIGASALILSGIEIDTSDIDILVSDRDAIYLQNKWADKIIKNHIRERSDLFRSNFARFHFEELDIEIMGDLNVKNNGIWSPLYIQDYFTLNLGSMQIKLPTIEEQVRIFNLFGREKNIEKVNKIRRGSGMSENEKFGAID